MKIFLDVIGCRLNQSEVEGFANTFRALGHQIVGDPGEADLAIVNTCAVTVKAAADSRKQLRRAARKGASQVVATGCWVTLYPEKALDLEGVTSVFVNDKKDDLVPDVLGLEPTVLSNLNLVRIPLPGDRARTRAFIKVQEGCDNYCTYCLTRLARGKSRSRQFNDIQQDIKAALDGEAKEIVLTGVQLGAWGRDLPGEKHLGDLLAGVLNLKGFDRLRLSSIEPWDFDPALLSFWKDERLCRHLHIPLQSGDEGILQAMGRPITASDFADLVSLIRREIPQIALTTDVIAGFPGESEEQFLETKSMIKTICFAGGHVFSYSPRPGTAAFKMKNRMPVQVVKARNAQLRETFKNSGCTYRERFIGRQIPVLWETSQQSEDGSWRLSGLTDNYIRVYASSDVDLWNQISEVRITAHHPARDALTGVVGTAS